MLIIHLMAYGEDSEMCAPVKGSILLSKSLTEGVRAEHMLGRTAQSDHFPALCKVIGRALYKGV